MVLVQGVVVLLTGMGLTVLFLLTLIGVMNVSAKIVPLFDHLLPTPVPAAPKKPAAKTDDMAPIAAAIAAARCRG